MKPTAVAMLAAMIAAATPVLADDLPTRRPGLWETTTITKKGRVSARQCVDRTSDRFAYSAMRSQNCTDNRLRDVGDGSYLAEATCKRETFTAQGRVSITGDFQTSARAESTTTMTGLPGEASPMVVTTTVETRYLGDCGPGQSPGDMIMPNGQIVHVPSIKR